MGGCEEEEAGVGWVEVGGDHSGREMVLSGQERSARTDAIKLEDRWVSKEGFMRMRGQEGSVGELFEFKRPFG